MDEAGNLYSAGALIEGPIFIEPTDKAAWIQFASSAVAGLLSVDEPWTLESISKDAAKVADLTLTEMKKRFP